MKSFEVHESIYPPSSDTYILYNAIIQDIENDNNYTNHQLILFEIGIGSGYIISNINFNYNNIYCIGSDLNKHINKNTTQFYINKYKKYTTVNYDILHGSLLKFIDIEFIDIIVFNPPYVHSDPLNYYTKEYEPNNNIFNVVDENFINYLATDGGKNGREVIDLFINDVCLNVNLYIKKYIHCKYNFFKILTVYLLLIEVNNVNDVIEMFKNYIENLNIFYSNINVKFYSETIKIQQVINEKIFIIKFLIKINET